MAYSLGLFKAPVTGVLLLFTEDTILIDKYMYKWSSFFIWETSLHSLISHEGFSHNSVTLELDILKIKVIIWLLLQDGLPQIIFVPLKNKLCKKQWMYILGPGGLLQGFCGRCGEGRCGRAGSVELLFVSGAASLSYSGCKFPGNCPCSSGLDLHFTEFCPKWQTTSEVLQPLIEFPCSWSPTWTTLPPPLHPVGVSLWV